MDYTVLCKTHNLETSTHHRTLMKESYTQLVKDKILEHQQSKIHLQSPYLKAYLESQASKQGCSLAHGLAEALKGFNFVATVYLLSDILPQVSRLSLVFQTATCIYMYKHVNVHVVNLLLNKPQVSATIAAIRRFKSSPGPYYMKLDEALSSLAIDVTLEEKERFKTYFTQVYTHCTCRCHSYSSRRSFSKHGHRYNGSFFGL